MGRERYWGGCTSTKRAAGDGVGGHRESPPAGCMSAVLQLFDFHPFQFALNHQHSFKPDSFLPEDHTILEGVEAPRNSLESEEPIIEAASLSSIIEQEGSLNISVGIQIKTSSKMEAAVSKARTTDDLSSESSCSPAAKTPNLVARLMGLDLLPESSNHETPVLLRKPQLQHHLQPLNSKCESGTRQPLQTRPASHRNFFDNDIAGTRSLPETPRISSARRSDADPRLSLQINKENTSFSEELLARFSSSTITRRRSELRHEEENRSPSHYARQIVKQVKESVGRRVGLDITNTVGSRDQREEPTIKLKKPLKVATSKGSDQENNPSKHSTTSCSPRLRFLETRNKPALTTTSVTMDQIAYSPKLPSSTTINNHSQPTKISSKQKHQEQQQQQKSIQKCKKAASERFSSRLNKPPKNSDVIRNKQEEPFVRPSTSTRSNGSERKCKKTPLSNDLLNISVVPTLIPFRKLDDPSPPTSEVPQEQACGSRPPEKGSSRLPSCLNPTYKQQATSTRTDQEIPSDQCNSATTSGGGAEVQYISRILKCTGIDNHTPTSPSIWFSPSHPLDPSTFHHLELSLINTSRHGLLSIRSNRKLIFDLVDEILVDILKPYVDKKPWDKVLVRRFGHDMHGHQVLQNLCTKIRSFPLADCKVLEDIDALIGVDLTRSKVQSWEAYGEEGEGIALEIEKDILDSLVQETAAVMGHPVPYAR